MLEMTCPSKSERELKSMQSVGGSLVSENLRDSSMMLKNHQGEGGETVFPAPPTVSVSTLQFAKTANHTGKSTLLDSQGLWKSPPSTQMVSNLKDEKHFLYPVSIATSESNTTTSSRSFSDLSLLTGGSGNSTKKERISPHQIHPKKTK